MDCHSDETKWPWYAPSRPISWLAQKDEGRRELNLSTDAPELDELIREGSIPSLEYKPAQPVARLSAAEERHLIRGLQASFGAGGGRSRSR